VEEFTSSQFGVLRYETDQVMETPCGLPAFESERRFLAIEKPENAPIVFLQSLQTPELAFITLPVTFLAPDYAIEFTPEDLETLKWVDEQPPRIDHEVLCLALVTVGSEPGATANLMAPLVVNLANRRTVQVIQTAGYSHQHPLGANPEGETC
jgi:flagellar assembly factor FliW